METGPLLDEAYIATGEVVHIFRDFPLDFHPNAMPASQAGYCAGQQDPQFFWGMHDWLFETQETWSGDAAAADSFREHALSLGADAGAYDECIAAPETTTHIQQDMQDGAMQGVSGTPAFFVDAWFLSGAQPFEAFSDAIEKAKQGLEPPPTPTPLPPNVAPYDADPARPGLTYDGSPSLGDPDARLVLIGFEDFKCGYCAQHATTVEKALIEKYVDTGQLRLVFKFFPIYAPKAAVASLCAADQGKFWEFQDLLFENQSQWEDGVAAGMLTYANRLDLDVDAFNACLGDEEGKMAQISADMELGQQLGVRGTPNFLLIDVVGQNGTNIPGALPLDQFEQAIEGFLNPATPTPTP